jgi:hypothetical protein
MRAWHHLLSAAAAVGLASMVNASDGYDNPGTGDTPCVVLESYQSLASGTGSFGAEATVENICGRSVEIAFCFPFVAPGEDTEPHCTSRLIRPWATSRIAVTDLPARLAGPDYRWRWHGPLSGSDR